MTRRRNWDDDETDEVTEKKLIEQETKDRNYIKRFIKKAIAIASLTLLGYTSFYSVDESEHAIVTTFGNPSKVVINPIKDLTAQEEIDGLKKAYEMKGISVSEGAGFRFKYPWQSVIKLDKRFNVWNTGAPEEISTKDKTYIFIDVASPWRVEDPLLFQTSVQGNPMQATTRLDTTLDSLVRNTVMNTSLVDLVRQDNRPMIFSTGDNTTEKSEGAQKTSQNIFQVDKTTIGREKVAEAIAEKAREDCTQYGVVTGDLFMKRVEYVDSVKVKIEDRMSSERLMTAEKLISEGDGEYSRIMGEKGREVSKIISEAKKHAAVIRGNADAEAIRILAEGYKEVSKETGQEISYKGLNSNPEFYQFKAVMDLYSQMGNNGKDATLLLGTDNPIFGALKGKSLIQGK